MIKYSELTKRGQAIVGIVGVSAIVSLMGIAGAIESQSAPASVEQCEEIVFAIWELDLQLGNNIAEDMLIEEIKDMGCQWEEGLG
jgi:hypothetical protein